MIELENFTIGYQQRFLLKDVSTQFPSKSLTALIGRNGCGKSTLLKTICRLSDNYRGEIFIDGENIRNISGNRLSEKIAYVNPMRPRIANLKCKDIVALGRSPYTNWHGKLSADDHIRIKRSISLVKMESYEDRYFNSLSDGESQKIMIARAIAQDTEIIILDEPTSFLDLPTRYELVELLKKLTEENEKTIIYSTHELDLALKKSDYVALMESGKLYNLPASEMADSDILSHLIQPQ